MYSSEKLVLDFGIEYEKEFLCQLNIEDDIPYVKKIIHYTNDICSI